MNIFPVIRLIRKVVAVIMTSLFKCTVMVFCISLILCSSSVQAKKPKPMRVRPHVEIPDGEYLRYGIYTRGEKTGDFYMVTRYLSDTIVKVYIQFNYLNLQKPVPPDYHDFSSYGVVNLKTASLIRYVLDEEDFYVKQNKEKGGFYLEADINNDIKMVMKYWDGYEVRESRSRVKQLDPRYPVWDKNSFPFWGARLLDWENGGIVQICVFGTLKDPVYGTLFPMGEEKIQTPRGEINAKKVGWRISDAFVGALMKNITDAIYFWIDKTDECRLVKMKMDLVGQTFILEEMKIVR